MSVPALLEAASLNSEAEFRGMIRGGRSGPRLQADAIGKRLNE